MGIRINTNVSSLTAQRYFGINNASLSKTLERLSSGLRINHAGDDAAGLAISEKLRTQVRGMSQAIANAQDGINLIATAEGGTQQISDILQRMRELTIQAANDTLINADRGKVQDELNQLREELSRVGNTTEFNTRKLLDGTLADSALGKDATVSVKQNVRIGNTAATIAVLSDFITSAAVSTSGATVDTAFQIKFVSFQGALTDPVSVAIEIRSSIDGVITTIRLLGGAAVSPTQIQLSIGNGVAGSLRATVATLNVNTSAVSLSDIGKTALVQLTAKRNAVTIDSGLTFHIGANEGQFLKTGIQDIRGAALRMESLSVLGTNDEDSRARAQNSIGVIDQALEFVNAVRARLGAIQNRMEYAISYLQISREAQAASESRIRDADIAGETAALTRSQILVQAGTAMLAQANATSQSALGLLRG